MTPHFPIYLDYGATTPVDPRVVDAMIPWLREHFGNPASRSHAWGWEAEEAVEKARGAGRRADRRRPARDRLDLGRDRVATTWRSRARRTSTSRAASTSITVKTEHKAVLDTMRELERQGFEVTYLDVQENGLLDLDEFKDALRKDTILVSVMFVNNEIGVIQDIAGDRRDLPRARHRLPRRRGAGHRQGGDRPGHAAGRPDEPGLAQDLRAQGHRRAVRAAQAARAASRRRCTAAATSAACARARCRRTRCVGMGEAFAHRAGRDGRRERAHPHAAAAAGRRPDRHRAGLHQRRPRARVPHNLNISFNYVEGESLIMGVKGLAVSSGSACTSASLEPSYVLRALGRSDELAHSSLRMTIGRFTTEEEIDYAVEHAAGPRGQAARAVAAVGDVQGRHRHQHASSGRRTERDLRDKETRHGIQRQGHRPLREPAQRRLLRQGRRRPSAPAWSARRPAAT